MKEKILTTKKNGLLATGVISLLYLLAIGMCILGGIMGDALIVILGVVWLCIGWFPFLGLKVLKPQEALVFTLFGNYVGTIKEEGFYFVNPFCVAVNPAAKTKLNQSGDVKQGKTLNGLEIGNGESFSKKISTKVMTLNNQKQKINDCLGNPIEIGIAVTWRVADTAQAVFQVDNYKEYLSLQCDGSKKHSPYIPL